MSSKVELIPKLCVQSDWNNPTSTSDTAWFSYANKGQETKYENLEINTSTFKQDLPLDIPVAGNITATLTKKNVLELSDQKENREFKMIAASSEFCAIHQKAAINSIDVSSGGELGVSADSAGKLLIWNTKTGATMRQLIGHVSTVSRCRFFPSGVVVLSGGDDMLLKVWSAEDASCPVTFMGHTAGIVDTAFVDRGKNVISCSRDGSTRLWDCSTSKCVSVLAKESFKPTFCSLAPTSLDDEKKGDNDRILLSGYENGNVHGTSLKDQHKIFDIAHRTTSVVDCCFIDDNLFVLAYDDGMVCSYDTRSTSQPLRSLSFYKTKPVAMTTDKDQRLVMSTADGCCLCFNIRDANLKSITSLTGPDCDPINDVSTYNNAVYTACRDGIIRSYYL